MRFTSKVLGILFFAALGLNSVHAQTATFTLSIEGFNDGDDVPLQYSQAADGALPGGGTSPKMLWENAPAGTQSFVVNMLDLDFAPNRGTKSQVHWLVWNIPGSAAGLEENQPQGDMLPNGASQISATGRVYRGPGAGAAGPKHHYLFEVYALDVTLSVMATDDPIVTRDAVLAAMEGHVLGKSVYIGMFRRPQ